MKNVNKLAAMVIVLSMMAMNGCKSHDTDTTYGSSEDSSSVGTIASDTGMNGSGNTNNVTGTNMNSGTATGTAPMNGPGSTNGPGPAGSVNPGLGKNPNGPDVPPQTNTPGTYRGGKATGTGGTGTGNNTDNNGRSQ